MSWLNMKSKSELQHEIEDGKREIARLTTLNTDMDHQIRDLIVRRELSEEQWAEYTRIKREHIELAQGQAEIVTYLRNRYPDDFKTGGRNEGVGFGTMVVRYLKGLTNAGVQ
jgi:hypothetical protein